MRIYYNSLLKKIISIPVSYFKRSYGLIKKANVNDTGSLNIAIESVSNTYDPNVGRSYETQSISDLNIIPGEVDKVYEISTLKSADYYNFPTDISKNTGSLKNVDYYYIPTDTSDTSGSLKSLDYYDSIINKSSNNINLSEISTSEKEIDKANISIKLSSTTYLPAENIDNVSNDQNVSSISINEPLIDNSSGSVSLNKLELSDVGIEKVNQNVNIRVDYSEVTIDTSTNKESLKSIDNIVAEIDTSINSNQVGSIQKQTDTIDIGFDNVNLKSIDKNLSEVDKSVNTGVISNINYNQSEVDKSSLKGSLSTLDLDEFGIDKSTETMSININYGLIEVDKSTQSVSIGSIVTQSLNGLSDDASNSMGLSNEIDPSSRIDFNPTSLKNYVRQFNTVYSLTGSVVTQSIINYTDDLEFTVIGRHQSEEYKDNMDYNIPYRASFVTRNWPYYTYDTASHYNLPKLFNASDTVLKASRDIWITASFENGTSLFTDQWGFAVDL